MNQLQKKNYTNKAAKSFIDALSAHHHNETITKAALEHYNRILEIAVEWAEADEDLVRMIPPQLILGGDGYPTNSTGDILVYLHTIKALTT